MDPETFIFRRFLYQISNCLSSSEVSNLKFMLNESLPRRQLEDAVSGFDIFCLMEEKGFLSSTELGLLREILETVGKSHVVQQYLSTRGSMRANDVIKPIPGVDPLGGPPPQRRAEGIISSHKRLLGDLAGELSGENVHDMALFFHGGNSSIHVRDLDRLKTAESVFKKLEGSRTIREGDYTILYNVLDVIGRQDLCDTIAQYCYNQGNGLRSPVRAAESGALPTYPHQPSLSPNSLNTSYPSSYSGSSMESRDGVHNAHSMIVGPGVARVSPASMDAQIALAQLETQERYVTAELAHAKRRDESAQIRELEEMLHKVTTQLEQTRKALNRKPTKQRPPSYDMNASPHGTALVIVNGQFDKNPLDPELELEKRNGAPEDRILLKQTFKTVRYEIKDRTNLTALQMHEEIEAALKDSDTDNADSFVCCVSSHGTASGLFGSDSLMLKWEEIHALATKYMHGKPKMFFFQSCRKPHTSVKADGPTSPLQGLEDADIYKVYACPPNQEAYIANSGSWLATSLHRHFTDPQKMHEHDLVGLVNYVADEIQTMVGRLVDENEVEQDVAQCLHRESTLHKCVYFFPEQ